MTSAKTTRELMVGEGHCADCGRSIPLINGRPRCTPCELKRNPVAVHKQDLHLDPQDLTTYELDTLWAKTDRATVELARALSADVRALITEARRRRDMGSREEAFARLLGQRNIELAEVRGTLDVAKSQIRDIMRELEDAREVARHQGRTVAQQEQELLDLKAELKIREKEVLDLRAAGCCGRAG